jgi:hypothetical protein
MKIGDQIVMIFTKYGWRISDQPKFSFNSKIVTEFLI